MESNKKRKMDMKNLNEGQLAYYKALRKNQKRKRRENKRKGIEKETRGPNQVSRPKTLQLEVPLVRPGAGAAVKTQEKRKKRELEEAEKFQPRGKRLVSVALQKTRRDTKKEPEAKMTSKRSGTRVAVEGTKVTVQRSTRLKEIEPTNLKRELGATSIGRGTFGTCYPAKYRGISVVIREYNAKSLKKNTEDCLAALQREARHEALVLERLGDHPRIPLLFDVCLK